MCSGASDDSTNQWSVMCVHSRDSHRDTETCTLLWQRAWHPTFQSTAQNTIIVQDWKKSYAMLLYTYSRQRETKLTKTGSQFFKMEVKSLDPGRRLRPLLLVMQRGLPLESRKSFERKGRRPCLSSFLFVFHFSFLVQNNKRQGKEKNRKEKKKYEKSLLLFKGKSVNRN